MQNDTSTAKIDIRAITPLDIAADTHPGLVRMLNEDSFSYFTSPGNKCTIAAVADGIGGHESGDIASCLCLKMLMNAWRGCHCRQQIDEDRAGRFLKTELERSNETIFNLNSVYNIAHPMGTTVVASVFLADCVVVAHAGDSRLYRLRDGSIKRLTEDHSFVSELVRKKIISEEEAQTHPFSHIISKSVGPSPKLEPELKVFDRRIGDRFLLCTDGLTQHMDDNALCKILGDAYDPLQVVHELMNNALRAGGEDNITVVCVFA